MSQRLAARPSQPSHSLSHSAPPASDRLERRRVIEGHQKAGQQQAAVECVGKTSGGALPRFEIEVSLSPSRIVSAALLGSEGTSICAGETASDEDLTANGSLEGATLTPPTLSNPRLPRLAGRLSCVNNRESVRATWAG